MTTPSIQKMASKMQFAAISNSILAFSNLDRPKQSYEPPLFSIHRTEPSFITVHGNILYTLSEIDNGSVASYDISKPNAPLVSTKDVPGAPAHVAVSPRGFVGLANYGGGSVSFFSCDYSSGVIGDKVLEKKFAFQTLGPNAARQTQSHPHQIAFSSTDSIVYVPDLGMDMIHRFDTLDFTKDLASIKITSGYGPRHVLIVGDLILVSCELVSKVIVLRNGQIVSEEFLLDEIHQHRSRKAEDYYEHGTSAEIKVLGDNLYVSQRMNHENGFMIHLKLNHKDGIIKKIKQYPLNGKTPRHFGIDGQKLYVALQDQPFMEIFSIDLESGSLSMPPLQVHIGDGQKCVDFS